MESASERLIELTRRLKAATDAGQLEWVAVEDTAFSWTASHGAVGVRSRDGDGEEPYELDIFGAERQKVETLASEWTARAARPLERGGGASLPCCATSGARRRQDSRGPPPRASAGLGGNRLAVQALGALRHRLDRALEVSVPRAFASRRAPPCSDEGVDEGRVSLVRLVRDVSRGPEESW